MPVYYVVFQINKDKVDKHENLISMNGFLYDLSE